MPETFSRTTPQVHVCLVSDQAAPNLLPALDPSLKPREVVLLVSGKMQARAEALATVLHEAGVATTAVALNDEHDYARLETAMLEVATERDGQSIALNVTGGTKLMALAAQAVAVAAHWAVFYVDADTDEVIWLAPPRTVSRCNNNCACATTCVATASASTRASSGRRASIVTMICCAPSSPRWAVWRHRSRN